MIATWRVRWLLPLALAAACGGGKGDGPEPPSWRIGGTITGSVTAGVLVQLSGPSSGSAVTDGDGRWQIGARAGRYTVTPSAAGHRFSPASRAVAVAADDLAGLDFAASASAAALHAITGTVRGEARAGLLLHLSGATAASASTGPDGSYAFGGLADGDYLVSLPLTGLARSPESAPVVLAGADASGVDFAVSVPAVLEYPIDGVRFGIAAGPDGNLWFAGGSHISRITPGGDLTRFFVEGGADIQGVVAGPDGAMWFAEMGRGRVSRVTMSGDLVRYPVPCQPRDLAAGPDGNLWVTGCLAPDQLNAIVRLTTAGEVTTFKIPTGNAGAEGIAAGPDGNLWFAEASLGRIGRMTPDGDVTEYAIPTPLAAPLGIASGPDGALWFVESGPCKLGRISTSGTISEFPLPTPLAYPWKITADPEGALWFTEFGASKLGRFLPGVGVLEIPLPPGREPNGIAIGPDGHVWFTMSGAVGRL